MDHMESGHGKFNQLGGVFYNGKALPNVIRQQIVEMAELGIRPCDISRQLKVSHGCVSKLLSKYNDTGSFEPGRAQKKTSREVSPAIAKTIEEYRRTMPGIFSFEVKEKLLAEGVCTKETLPVLTDISRVLRKESSCSDERETRSLETNEDSMSLLKQEEGSELPTQRSMEIETSSLLEQSSAQQFSSKPTSVDFPSNAQLRNYYRRKRTRFRPEQILEMEAAFKKTHYPDTLMREELAERLNITESKILIWFSNRRSKEKRMKYGIKEIQEKSPNNSRIFYPHPPPLIPCFPYNHDYVEAPFAQCGYNFDSYKFCTCKKGYDYYNDQYHTNLDPYQNFHG